VLNGRLKPLLDMLPAETSGKPEDGLAVGVSPVDGSLGFAP
jgi:hypothetical protein